MVNEDWGSAAVVLGRVVVVKGPVAVRLANRTNVGRREMSR